MLYAIIDIGTNSVRYNLSDFSDGRILPLESAKKTTRLGEGLYTEERLLQKERIDDTVNAVSMFADSARQSGAKIICTATSAVRDAANKDFFRNRILSEAGIPLLILSGEDEALCGFCGALEGRFDEKNTVLADIGGGSTEIICKQGEVIVGNSFKCGCVRLRELFGKDYSKAESFIDNTISVPDSKGVVWIGGTASAVAMIYLNLKEYNRESVHLCKIPFEFIDELCKKAMLMNDCELNELCSFDTKRGEILPYGLMSIVHILKKAGAAFVTVSESGLSEGVILRKFGEQ